MSRIELAVTGVTLAASVSIGIGWVGALVHAAPWRETTRVITTVTAPCAAQVATISPADGAGWTRHVQLTPEPAWAWSPEGCTRTVYHEVPASADGYRVTVAGVTVREDRYG